METRLAGDELGSRSRRRWMTVGSVADPGSTLSKKTLTIKALGVAARRFKRAAA